MTLSRRKQEDIWGKSTPTQHSSSQSSYCTRVGNSRHWKWRNKLSGAYRLKPGILYSKKWTQGKLTVLKSKCTLLGSAVLWHWKNGPEKIHHKGRLPSEGSRSDCPRFALIWNFKLPQIILNFLRKAKSLHHFKAVGLESQMIPHQLHFSSPCAGWNL